MVKIKIKAFDSYKYCQVWVITEYKDNCVYRTEPIGYALIEDVKGIEDIIPASISTSYPKYEEKIMFRKACFNMSYMDLDIMPREQVISIRDKLLKQSLH